IPCRNEEFYIKKCLESVAKQNYPKQKIDVIVVDRMSTDSTREVVSSFNSILNIKILDNHKIFTPFALNMAVKIAKGDVLARIDAHSYVESNYIRDCVKALYDYSADSVGGLLDTLPRRDYLIDTVVVRAFANRFGTGNSYYKIGSKEVRETDTTTFFCCRKEVFEKNGLFNERLVRTQDMEWHKRLKRSGGRILVLPNVVVHYYIKSDFFGFLKHNFKNGIWSVLPFKYSDHSPVSARHLVPLVFVLSLLFFSIGSLWSNLFLYIFLFILISYLLLSLFFSIRIANKEKNFIFALISPIVFLNIHLGYGIGSLVGLILLLKPSHYEADY
ncbi:MAG: glycosyltransferase family 2 protein, partial [Parcubacteria group bacterium]|nr:glycosyltransferase family 2 protein [Parcubacteria group bacterium]